MLQNTKKNLNYYYFTVLGKEKPITTVIYIFTKYAIMLLIYF